MADVPATFVSAGHGPGPGDDPESERQEPLGLFWYTGAGSEGVILQDDLQTFAHDLPSTIPTGTPIYLWQGSVAATLAAKVLAQNWRTTRYVFALVPGRTALFAIPQDTYPAAAAATDLAGWVYRHATGWRRWQPPGVAIPAGFPAIALLMGACTDFFVDASTTYQPLVDGTHAYTTTATAIAALTLPYPPSGGLSTGTHTLGLSANRIAGLRAGTVVLVTKDAHLWQFIPADASGLVTDITPTIPTLLAGAIQTDVLGVASDGTTTWILCDQIDGLGGWGLYVLSTTDLATWTTLRTVSTIVSGIPTTTAVGVGEGGAILIAANYANTADTSGLSTLSWSYAVGSSAPVALGAGASLLQGDLNLSYGRFSVSLNPQPGWVSGASQNGFLALRFGAGPEAPIWATEQAIIDNAGAIDTSIFPLNVCGDGSSGLWAVEAVHGNLVHRAGAKGTAWTVVVTGLVTTTDAVPHLAISRQVANSLVCLHGFNNGLGFTTRVSYVDLTTHVVTTGPAFDVPTETFDRIDGTSNSALYNQHFVSACEAGHL